jgi:hypothetical protein
MPEPGGVPVPARARAAHKRPPVRAEGGGANGVRRNGARADGKNGRLMKRPEGWAWLRPITVCWCGLRSGGASGDAPKWLRRCGLCL